MRRIGRGKIGRFWNERAGAQAVTREHKLALIVGFSLILLVGVLISDHLSKAGMDELGNPPAGAPVLTASAVDEAPAVVLALPEPKDWALPPDFRSRAVVMETGTPARPPAAVQEPSVGAAQVPARLAAADQPAVIRQGTLSSVVEGAQGLLSDAAGLLGDGGAFLAADRSVLAETQPAARRTGPASGAANAAASEARVAELNPALFAQEREYIVKPGDSLSKIAEATLGSRDRWPEIMRVNQDRLTDPALVRAGMKLRLPVNARQSLAGATPAQRPAAPAASGGREGGSVRTYTVRKGDTLSQIAQRTMGSVVHQSAIMKLNGLDDPNRIFVGMELKIPERG